MENLVELLQEAIAVHKTSSRLMMRTDRFVTTLNRGHNMWSLGKVEGIAFFLPSEYSNVPEGLIEFIGGSDLMVGWPRISDSNYRRLKDHPRSSVYLSANRCHLASGGEVTILDDLRFFNDSRVSIWQVISVNGNILYSEELPWRALDEI